MLATVMGLLDFYEPRSATTAATLSREMPTTTP
jgi:hypothetical protein